MTTAISLISSELHGELVLGVSLRDMKRVAVRSTIATLPLYLKSKNCCATVELIINRQEGVSLRDMKGVAVRSTIAIQTVYLKSKN
ncbi:hypothetical protein [Dapis sp. BLCC M229]|uniref:hypothetical protein n=1 Tax=Dapis sp. BLCC M229 TaxID=3400188 RepID=UPI003CF2D113